MHTNYNDYGYCENNATIIKSDTKGIDDKVIGSIYTIQEEEREWKKKLIQRITNEHEDTREKVNEHTTDEVTNAKTELIGKLDDINSKLSTASANIIAIKNSQDAQTNLLNNINNKIK